MLDTSLGIYCQGQTKLTIFPLKVLMILGKKEHVFKSGELIHNATEKYNNTVVAK